MRSFVAVMPQILPQDQLHIDLHPGTWSTLRSRLSDGGSPTSSCTPCGAERSLVASASRRRVNRSRCKSRLSNGRSRQGDLSGRSPCDRKRASGSSPVRSTSDLQGFLPLDPPPDQPIAILLQPKCLVVDGRVQPSLGPNGTSLSGSTANETVQWSASRGSRGIGSRTHLGLRDLRVKQAQEWLSHSHRRPPYATTCTSPLPRGRKRSPASTRSRTQHSTPRRRSAPRNELH